MQVDAFVGVALEVLVEAQHAVAAVVHDHGGQGDPLLSRGGQHAARVEKTTVTGDADHWRGFCQRGPRAWATEIAELMADTGFRLTWD